MLLNVSQWESGKNSKEKKTQVASFLFLVKGKLQLFLLQAADEDRGKCRKHCQ